MPKQAAHPKLSDLYYTRFEVLNLFGVCKTTLYLWVRDKKIETTKHPLTGKILFKKDYIDNLLKGHGGLYGKKEEKKAKD